MNFSMKFNTSKSGCSIIYTEGSQVLIFKIYCISFFEDWFFVLANSADLMKYHILWHFISVFKTSQFAKVTYLGVSVSNWKISFFKTDDPGTRYVALRMWAYKICSNDNPWSVGWPWLTSRHCQIWFLMHLNGGFWYSLFFKNLVHYSSH